MSDPQRGAVEEALAALYGAREVCGRIGNIQHAIELCEAALRSRPSRDEALEEAAVACEKYQDNVADRLADFSSHWQLGAAAGAEDCSEAIRALKSQPAAQPHEQSSVPGVAGPKGDKNG